MFWSRKLSNKSLVAIKASLLAAVLIGLVVFFSSVIPVFAAHTSSASLYPRWNKCELTSLTYTVTITNDGPDAVDEVRIYENANYTGFNCSDKQGWEKHWIEAKRCCHYIAEGSGYHIKLGGSDTFTFNGTPSVECNQTWKFETRDTHEVWHPIYNWTIIDCTKPVTTKNFIGPQKESNGIEWINSKTLVNLTGVDQDPHPSGLDKTWYGNYLSESDKPCWNPAACFVPGYMENCIKDKTGCVLEGQEICKKDWSGYDSWQECAEDYAHGTCGVEEEWHIYTEPFNKTEESCHILYYLSVDNVGNIEDVKVNCFFVDKTPPEVEKITNEPKFPLCELELPESAETYTEADMNNNEFDVTVTKTSDGNKVKWIIDIDEDDISGHWSTGVQVIIANTTNPLFNLGWSPGDSTTDPIYKPWTGCPTCWKGWGTATTVLPSGMSVSGNYNETYYEIEIPIEYLEGCPYYWAINVEATWPGHSSAVQQNYPANWDRWTATNTAQGGLGNNWWVTPDSEIVFTCTDQGPHPSDDEELCFKVSYDKDPDGYNTDEYCTKYAGEGAYMEGHWCCVDASPEPKSPFVFNFNEDEDSLHDLEYFCRDAVNKTSEIEIQYYRVDSTPPEIYKEVIGPQVGQCDPIVDYQCWIKDWKYEDGTTIQVEVTDPEVNGCAVNEIECEWWYYVEGRGPYQGGSELPPPFNITFDDETEHELHINCSDALGNWYEDVEYFYVDSTGPNVSKNFIGPSYQECYVEWIDTATTIELIATEYPTAPCGVGLDKIYYINTLAATNQSCLDMAYCNPTHSPGDPEWVNYTGPFNKSEESCHILEYYAVDKLGNVGPVGVNCFFVDKTPPIVSAITGKPKIDCTGGQGCDYWIRDDVTSITLSCYDPQPHPSGVKSIEYRWKLDGQWPASNPTGDWLTYTDPIIFHEDSLHELEYRCTDNVNKTRVGPGKIYRVDSTPPETTKEIIGPKYEDDEDTYINGVTNISLTCVDKEEPCAVGVDNIQYRYRVDGGEWTKWFIYSEPFGFPEESYHELEYYCNDTLGNKEDTHTQYYYVDKTPPVTTKHYEGPQWPEDNVNNNHGPKWITNETNITFSAHDEDGLHASGVKEIYIRDVYLDDKEDWHYCYTNCSNWPGDPLFGLPTAPEPYNPSQPPVIHLEEESCHIIEYYSVDNVNKTEDVKWQCVFVDNTPPDPVKTVEDPKTEWHPTTDLLDPDRTNFYPEIVDKCWSADPAKYIECWKVTLFTTITLDCEDPAPHPVDEEETCYKVEVDADDKTEHYCVNITGGDYNKYGDGFCCGKEAPYPFQFNEETEHNLKYYCVDALGNKGTKIDEEKFKVEGTKFEIQLNKKWNLISVPFVMLDNSMDEVFKDIEDDIISVWGYNGAGWLVWSPNGANTLTEMIPGWGYWVLANESTMLQIGGSLFSPAATPPSKEIVPGWNLIGYYGADNQTGYYGPVGNGKSVYCKLYSLIDTTVGYPKWSSLITYWEPGVSVPERCDPGIPLWKCYFNMSDKMDPGAGYWLEIDEDEKYSFSTFC